MKYETLLIAVDASIAVWKEMAKKGHIYKEELSAGFYYRIKNDRHECPLCQYRMDTVIGRVGADSICPGCPLERCGFGSLYSFWCLAAKPFGRKRCAWKIVKKLKKWKKENKDETLS